MKIRVSPDVSVSPWTLGAVVLATALILIVLVPLIPSKPVEAQDACARYFKKAIEAAETSGMLASVRQASALESLAWSAIYENCRKYGGR